MNTHYHDADLQNLGKGISRGPWWACCTGEPDGEAHYVFGANPDIAIAMPLSNDPEEPNYEPLERPVTQGERRANARLIAAAPQLLEDVIQARRERDMLLRALRIMRDLKCTSEGKPVSPNWYRGFANQAIKEFEREHSYEEKGDDEESEEDNVGE